MSPGSSSNQQQERVAAQPPPDELVKDERALDELDIPELEAALASVRAAQHELVARARNDGESVAELKELEAQIKGELEVRRTNRPLADMDIPELEQGLRGARRLRMGLNAANRGGGQLILRREKQYKAELDARRAAGEKPERNYFPRLRPRVHHTHRDDSLHPDEGADGELFA